mmetsp:Transcript_24990/g.57783  ORF Transcript_24990/g.57783 Transcript_24990/m.57783 type:complete len:200 (-) Transcript_24990:897-1496(-)
MGLGDRSELLSKHKINGKVVHLLNDEDLKDIGISAPGDRLKFKKILNQIRRKQRAERRNRIILQEEETLYYNKFDRCLDTCCFLRPENPSTYTLTTHHIEIKKVDKVDPCGIKICGCCRSSYTQNNIDLTQIIDIDIINKPPPCWAILCRSEGRAELIISCHDETITIELRDKKGEEVMNAIMRQVEQNHVINWGTGGC